MTLNSTQILMYLTAVVFGVIVGNYGTSKLRCNQVSTLANMFRGKDRLSGTDLRNTNNSNQSNTFPMKKYFDDAYTRSLPILSQRNLVISAAVGSRLSDIYRFSRSLRATCASCTLVLIVMHTTMYNNDFQELADLYSIVYISFDEYTPAHLRADSHIFGNIMPARYIVINNYLLTLKAKGEVYDNVFICDSYDTIFQTNVFAHINVHTPGLYVFMEDVRMTIGICKFNTDWIQKCFGEAEFQKLYNESIHCAGTVLGTWSAILSFLSVMESVMLKAPSACKAVGIDQATLNYIIYNNKIPNVKIHRISHEYGFVGTLGYVLWMRRNQFGLVQNANGSVYAVIHQWNRSQQMKDQLQREYQLIPPNVRERKN